MEALRSTTPKVVPFKSIDEATTNETSFVAESMIARPIIKEPATPYRIYENIHSVYFSPIADSSKVWLSMSQKAYNGNTYDIISVEEKGAEDIMDADKLFDILREDRQQSENRTAKNLERLEERIVKMTDDAEKREIARMERIEAQYNSLSSKIDTQYASVTKKADSAVKSVVVLTITVIIGVAGMVVAVLIGIMQMLKIAPLG